MEGDDDYDHPQQDLVYSPTLVPGRGANLMEFENQLLGCDCLDEEVCLSSTSCQTAHVCQLNYTSNRILIEEKWDSAGIVECNTQCHCSVQRCFNRLVQFGPRKNLEIFICGPQKGYGLRSQDFIPKGAFICEYAGEVIGLDEAKCRFKSLYAERKMNYIFVLREVISLSESTSVIETIVDPSLIGNIGRYINHSCDPNSGIVPVRIDTPIPRLGIFAKKNILPGEEITYDYSGGGLPSQPHKASAYERKPCYCGAKSCVGYLPFDSSLL
ncbi:Histone-lysine N-methyltransferase SETMAR [Frankliniella fusca]|uniref:Histone-lysine N-methyltransferase SETMAR n=1 Tax=Frankliniella fusca TaxID=407009 RepID=A0AAE1HUN3_9NEOP|nr:Histone-lysine N-methyltransferase SETMAR [Frankliniella fusca]